MRRIAKQGDFDGLCGPYAIVNALRLGDMGFGKLNKPLFRQLTYGLGAVGILEAMDEGLEADDLYRSTKLAFDWLASTWAIHAEVKRPYQPGQFESSDAFMEEAREELFRGAGLVISIRGPRLDHWTVASAIKDGKLTLRDSTTLTSLRLSTLKLDKGPWKIVPHETLRIRRFS